MHVIITGGSSGIGLAVARLAAADGHHVSIIGRDIDRLKGASRELRSVPGATILSVTADVANREQIEAAIAECVAQFGHCDLLVASAGVVEPAFFVEMPPSTFQMQVETNFFGVVNAVRAVLPAMQKERRGSIMIVSSGAALIGLPGYAAYCASKAALVSFAESLRCETEKEVKIAVAFPPDTDTPQLVMELPKRSAAARGLMGKSPIWPVETVANEIYGAFKTGRETVHFGWKLKALALLGPLVKPLIYRYLSRRV
ncbi:SDR family oxidoreductase [Agrobacterium larrymoorei]|uniref:SDR family oxidoreductase n=1 Tax=Agrobacterium larrymoorei TaxID=160699 RepID=UPI00157338FB|nr:SDR family oxidoreductase [Agrobacterium larrymoorei]NTJ43585.1 SDR family oxidoreductase [Agrobacterium larrymoorei]